MSTRSSYDSDFTYSTQSRGKSAAIDLKSQLFGIMKEKGLIDKLKTQIRQNLISEISAKESVFNLNGRKGENDTKNIDLFYHASISIIYEYLSKQKLQYTQSVFAPEVGVSPEKFYNSEELMRILQLDHKSEFYNHLNLLIQKPESNFLLCLLKTISEMENTRQMESDTKIDKSVQPIPLSEKMQKLDLQFEDRQKQGILKTQQLYEDRIIAFQRDIEKRLRHEMENEIQRFKDHELSLLQLKEEENFNKIIKEKSKLLEEEYQHRLMALKERERSSQENVQRYKESLDRENYLQRQQLLRDLTNLQDRELHNKKEKERIDREFEMIKEQYKLKMDLCDEKTSKLKESEMGLELRITQEIHNVKLTEEKRLANKWKEVEILEVKLKEEKHYLDAEKCNIEKMKEELLKRQSLFNEMEIINYPVLKQQNISLLNQIEDLKLQLGQQNMIIQQDKHKIDCLLKQKMGPNFEQSVLSNELERARDIFKRERTILEDQKEVLEKRLLEEIKNKRVITEQLSQQQDIIEVLSRQLSDFKDASYKNKTGYLSGRSQNNGFSSYRNNYTNRDLSPHSTNEFRRRNSNFDPSGNELLQDIDECSLPIDVEELANDAKHKLIDLDEETEQINKAYQEFKNRLANSSSAIGELSTFSPALISQSFNDGLQEGRKLKSKEPKGFTLPTLFESKSDQNLQFQNNENINMGQDSKIYESKFRQNVYLSNESGKILEDDLLNATTNAFKVSSMNESLDPVDNIFPSNVISSNNNKSVMSDANSEKDKSDIIHLDNNWKTTNISPNINISTNENESVMVTNLQEQTPEYEDEEIDPIVKQYMELVKKKKEEDKSNVRNDTTDFNEPESVIKTETEESGNLDGEFSDGKGSPNQSDSEAFW